MPQKADDAVRSRILNTIATPLQGHPGAMVPKEDKILEWSLVLVSDALQAINVNLIYLVTEVKQLRAAVEARDRPRQY